MKSSQVVIVGAGVSGLSCALELQRAGIEFVLLEKSQRVGGRIRTDEVDGFLLDRGFQVLNTAYPEAQRQLDLPRLKLEKFDPGALVRYQDRFYSLVDPVRRPTKALSTALSPVATVMDKLRIAKLRSDCRKKSLPDIESSAEMKTVDYLRRRKFSTRVIESFFRPFLGGIFLESDLSTSSRFFEFVFRMFALGDAVLPAGGMQAIPDQMASKLPTDSVKTETSVASVSEHAVSLHSGESIPASAVVVATDAATRAKLFESGAPSAASDYRSVWVAYFAVDRDPVGAPILVLNGSGSGPINNLSVPSLVSPTYAPPGQHLVSVTVLESAAAALDHDPNRITEAVKSQLVEWYGEIDGDWRPIACNRVDYALPDQATSAAQSPVEHSGVILAGDDLEIASTNGAMKSGRLAAEAILRKFERG